MNRKLFSIITPTYNCGSKIDETIQSVWNQNETLFEHIIVDGDSQDATMQRISCHDAKIKVISEPDRGVYDAMNKGIDLASGQYLYFLGAGDRLRPAILDEIAPQMPPQGQALVYGNVSWGEEGRIYDGEFTKARLRDDNICHQSIFYAREIFELLGKFELRFKVYADYVLNMKCFGHSEIAKKYIDLIVADYEGGGLSMNLKDEKFFEERAQLISDCLES